MHKTRLMHAVWNHVGTCKESNMDSQEQILHGHTRQDAPIPPLAPGPVDAETIPCSMSGSFAQMPWALADQVLLSLTNFITIVLLARGFTREALGEFTLVYSILLFYNTIQAGVVTQPHNILGAFRLGRRDGDYKRYTSTTLLSQVILGGTASLLSLLAWAIAMRLHWGIAPLLLALAPALLAWQFLEFARRVLYTEGRIAAAMAIDVLACVFQVAGIAWLWRQDSLTSPAALNMIAVASFFGAAFGFWHIRHRIAKDVSFAFIRENWHFGKWIVGGEIVGNWLSVQLFVYLSAAMLGAAAAGILRAVHTIFGPARILADFLCTMLPIHFSRVLNTQGRTGLHSQLILCHLVAVPLLGGYCLLVAVFAQPLLRLLYGDRYADFGVVLAVYSLAAFASYMMMIVAAALRARRSTRALFNGQLVGSLIALPIGWVSIRLFGISGTALGMLFSYALITLLLWRAYRLAGMNGMPALSAITPEERADMGQAIDSGVFPQSATTRPPLSCPASGPLLQRVLTLFDQAGIPYCITHGYEKYPHAISSDADLIMPAEVVRNRLAILLNANQTLLGAQIVQWIRQDSDYIVLMGVGESAVEHLCLDISSRYELCNREFLTCEEILSSRRRRGEFWIPSPQIEFACCLVRRIVKQNLSFAQAERLSQLYSQDPKACAAQVARFFGRAGRELIEVAAISGDWRAVKRRLPTLQSHLLLATAIRHPLSLVVHFWIGQWRRLRRWCRPVHGLHIVFLGPDGAGKSSVIRAIREQLGPAFHNTSARSFPPALLNRGDDLAPIASTLPHAAPPRSPIASTIRAICYWLTYQTVGHLFSIRVDRARCCLSLHDRHFVDSLVDPRRYRYTGPKRLLRWIWRITPKPDLLIVLDAPPQIIQARKSEVTLQETTRQCLEYRSLACELPVATVVDTSVTLTQTVRNIASIIINHMAARTQQQLGLGCESQRHTDVRHAIGVMTGESGKSWVLNKLGAGDQANVYEAFNEDGGVDSADRPRRIVVKLFRRDRPAVAMAAAAQFESLGKLHSLFEGLIVDGWRICVPKPMYLCQQPLALIMTKVPGQPLSSLLADANADFAPWSSAISNVLVSALLRFWSSGQRIYGDFTLSNALCDFDNRLISLVDPGIPEHSYECPEIARRWYPASRDVAYMIFDDATSIRQNLFHPTLRRHQRQVLMQMLMAMLGELHTPSLRRDFLAEVDACTKIHLRRIAVSWSLSGIRHFLVRCIGALRIRLIFLHLGNAVPTRWESEFRNESSSGRDRIQPANEEVVAPQFGNPLGGGA
jgi:O-antigen/teichoic acid export membrane protein/thymidylate kinase